MAAKRPSFLDKLEKELPEQPHAEPEKRGRVLAEAPAQPLVVRKDITKTTAYIPTPVHDRLREIAFAERIRVHELIMEGLDRVMESRGHPERTAKS